MDLQRRIEDYSTNNGYVASSFDSIACSCGSERFFLYSDDESGGAFVSCISCGTETDIVESRRWIETKVQNVCSCETEELQVMVGQALYEGTEDPRWTYVGAKCPSCHLAGVYADWAEH